MTNALFTPSGKRDTETEDDLDREPAAGSIARVGDSFDVVDGDGQPLRFTLLAVVDPAIVGFFDDGSAARFPNDWKGDWYDERRYVGVRIKMRHLESVPAQNLPVFTAIFDPITLIDSKGNAFRPDSQAWTLGANPIDGDQIKGVVSKDSSLVQGILFPVPKEARIEQLRTPSKIAREWYLGPVATLDDAFAEFALGLASSSQLIRYSSMALAAGYTCDAFGGLAEMKGPDSLVDIVERFKLGLKQTSVELPSVPAAARTLKDAVLREIIAGRIAPSAGIRHLYNEVHPRLADVVGKEDAWNQLALAQLVGGYFHRSLAEMGTQQERDQMLVETARKVQSPSHA